eukprot:TRINITY_DN19321_c0_g1_i2.p1 TRINITY_DN19321_c0_g1~~TRINITY_DN19321_c0_g1_i2.p1  ORF type:complete len:613 (+),score=155.06 TRINITY_DN19321_c0_g1_i2:28-1839(+)
MAACPSSSNLDLDSVLSWTGKVAKATYITERCKGLSGSVIRAALEKRLPGADGTLQSYTRADLMYDIKAGRLTVQAARSKSDRKTPRGAQSGEQAQSAQSKQKPSSPSTVGATIKPRTTSAKETQPAGVAKASAAPLQRRLSRKFCTSSSAMPVSKRKGSKGKNCNTATSKPKIIDVPQPQSDPEKEEPSSKEIANSPKLASESGSKRKSVHESVVVADPADPLNETLRSHGVTRKTYSRIEEAINHPLAPGLTDECRKMFLAMVPHSLCVRASARTKQQDASVQMLSDLFQDIMAEMQAQVDAESAKLRSLDASKGTLQAKVQDHAAALLETSEKYRALKVTLAETAKEVLACKVSLAQKRKEQAEEGAANKQAQTDKAVLEMVLAEDFRLLRDGDIEPEQATHHYEKLAAVVSKSNLDESLITALPGCMMKKPCERGSFDAMVVAQLEESLQGQIVRLTQTVAAGAPAAEMRQAAVLAASQQLELAKQARQTAADEFSVVDETRQQHENDRKAALAAIASLEPEFAMATKMRDRKAAELRNFTDWNLACFEMLRDRPAGETTSKRPKTTEPAAGIAPESSGMHTSAATASVQAADVAVAGA